MPSIVAKIKAVGGDGHPRITRQQDCGRDQQLRSSGADVVADVPD